MNLMLLNQLLRMHIISNASSLRRNKYKAKEEDKNVEWNKVQYELLSSSIIKIGVPWKKIIC